MKKFPTVLILLAALSVFAQTAILRINGTAQMTAGSISSSIFPNTVSTFYTSSVATNEYTGGIGIGTAPKSSNGQQAALQNLINQSVAVSNGTVIVDGCYTVAGLSLPGNARIIGTNGGGFIQMNNACGATLGNANWSSNGVVDTNIFISGLTVNVAMPYQHGNSTVTVCWETSSVSAYGIGYGRTSPNFSGAICGYLFAGVQGLTLTNCQVWDFDNKYSYGNYAFECFRATNITVINCHMDAGMTNAYATRGGDCIHFNGPTHNVTISGCVLRSTDDAIALNADDGVGTNHPYFSGPGATQYSPFYTGGEISDVTITNIFFDGAQAGIRLLSGADTIRNVTMDGLTGTVNEKLLGLNYYSSLVTCPFGNPLTSPNFTNIVFQNSTVTRTAGGGPNFQSNGGFIVAGQTDGYGTNCTAVTHIANLLFNNVLVETNTSGWMLATIGYCNGLTITNCYFKSWANDGGAIPWGYSKVTLDSGDRFLVISNRWAAFPGPSNSITAFQFNGLGTNYGQETITNFTAIGNRGTNVSNFIWGAPFVNYTNTDNLFNL